ncbi:hypothetical protein [Streptomyces sp. SID8379]|uniref:hypothetical protein n=1 Tax=Streptomyces sp. SID8379 TaxID=2690359 RepID=UPI00035C7B84
MTTVRRVSEALPAQPGPAPAGEGAAVPARSTSGVASSTRGRFTSSPSIRRYRRVDVADRVDEHVRDAVRAQLRTLPWGEVGDDADGAVRAAGRELVEPGVGVDGAAVRGGERHADAPVAQGLLRATDDLDRPQAVELDEDEVDDSAPMSCPPGLVVAAGP